MEFNINSPLLYILAGIAIVAVIVQSIVLMRKAWLHSKEIGIKEEKLKKVVTASAVMTIAPAIAVGVGIITLSGMLGIPLPWLRLSVVGSIVYELSAAETAAGALGVDLASGLTAQQYSTIAWTMTIGIVTGIFLIPVFCKKTVSNLSSSGMKDKKWAEHFSNALFFGLIATFVGQGFSGVTVDASGRVTACVLVVSLLTMVVLGILRKVFKWNWINDYALPICMIVGMASAIPLTNILG